jgi:hypothetical protein
VQAVWQEGAAQPPHGGDTAADHDGGNDDEFADETAETEALDEPRGLRGRLSSLIGRDIGDRGDDVEDRREPPLQTAPMPRIDPADRAGYDLSAPPQPAHLASTGMTRDDLLKLQSALHELMECRKLIDSAMVRGE